MAPLLLLPPRVRAELETLAAIGYPEEACGLLLGKAESQACTVHLQQATQNAILAGREDCFAIDPTQYLAVERVADGLQLAVIGVWHSHPDHPARPSRTDLEMAWPGWSYLIVSVLAGRSVDVRSWRLINGEFCEEEIRDA